MRFALWGGLFGALVAAGFQIQTYEMLHVRWIVTTAIGSAVVALLIGRPMVDWFKSLFNRPPARYH